MRTRYHQFAPTHPPEYYDPIPPGTEPGEECGRADCPGVMVEEDDDVICGRCGGKTND